MDARLFFAVLLYWVGAGLLNATSEAVQVPFKLLKDDGSPASCLPEIEPVGHAVDKHSMSLLRPWESGSNRDVLTLKVDAAAATIGPNLAVNLFCVNYQPLTINFGPIQPDGRKLDVREIHLKPRSTVEIEKILKQPLVPGDAISVDLIIRNTDQSKLITEDLILRFKRPPVGGCLAAIDKVEDVYLIVAEGKEHDNATILGRDISPAIEEWFPCSNTKNYWIVKTEFLHEISPSAAMRYRIRIQASKVAPGFYTSVEAELSGHFSDPGFGDKSSIDVVKTADLR